MIIQRAGHLLEGYMTISFRGLRLERLINQAAEQDILLWDIDRVSYTYMTAKIAIADFYALRPLVRKSSCKIHIVEKKGVPFHLHPHRSRYMFAAGLVLCLLLVYTMGLFVWRIEITGLENVPQALVLERLAQLGVRPGVTTDRLNEQDIKRQMMLSCPEFESIGITINGVVVQIQVQETVNKPDLIDRTEPADIVALKDGVIEELIVLEGKAMVKAGDTVRAGQLLIRGVSGKNESPAHALGQVYARTWYTAKGMEDAFITHRIPTGNVQSSRALVLRNWRLPLTYPAMHYDEQDEQTVDYLLLGQTWLPLKLSITKHEEIVLEKEERPQGEVRQLAADKAWHQVIQLLPEHASIIDKSTKYTMIKDEYICAEISIHAREDIAKTVRP